MTSGKDFPGIQIAGPSTSLELARMKALENRLPKATQDKTVNKTTELGAHELTAAKKAQIDEASTQFEALLLHQMFQSMWSTVPEEGILSGSREEEYFRDMFTQGLADTVAKGKGIGVKEVVAKEMYKAEGRRKDK